jgi:hypothetical protein
MTTMPETRSEPVSGWAVGFTAFAGAMMLLIGIFQAFAGLAAILNDGFLVRRPNYTFDISITGWGWIHLIIGLIVAAAGFGVFSGATWARAVGITVALLSAIANFFFIPIYPVWAVLIIAIDIIVIWALSVYTEEAATSRF